MMVNVLTIFIVSKLDKTLLFFLAAYKARHQSLATS